MHPQTLKHNPVSLDIEALSGMYDHDPKALPHSMEWGSSSLVTCSEFVLFIAWVSDPLYDASLHKLRPQTAWIS